MTDSKAAAPEGIASGWQHLATAPKDGTTVLLALHDYNIASVDFGWFTDHWRNYEGDWLSPTHWMSLPAPPGATIEQCPALFDNRYRCVLAHGHPGPHITKSQLKWNVPPGQPDPARLQPGATTETKAEPVEQPSHNLTDENIAARIAFCWSAGGDPLVLNEWRIGDIDWRSHCAVEAVFLKELQRLRAVAPPGATTEKEDDVENMRARKDAAYDERNRMVAVLSKLWPSHLALHPESDTTWERDWMTIVCIHSPMGQLTWHMHDDHRPMFAHLAMGEGHWDGHTTEQKYQRLNAFAPPGAEEPAPQIICLCGSTRFIETFAVKTWELELEGFIVLGCTLLPSWYCPVRDHFAETLGVKAQRDEHHLRKIDLADRVLVLNVGGYIGESTRNEIAYANRTGKPVDYLEPIGASDPVSPSPAGGEKTKCQIKRSLKRIKRAWTRQHYPKDWIYRIAKRGDSKESRDGMSTAFDQAAPPCTTCGQHSCAGCSPKRDEKPQLNPIRAVASIHSHFNIYRDVNSAYKGEITLNEQIKAMQRFVRWHERQTNVGRELLRKLSQQAAREQSQSVDAVARPDGVSTD